MFMSKAAGMANYGSTDRVRRFAAEQYIEPARRRGEEIVKIHSGTFGQLLVEQKVLPPNRFPIICNALRSKRLSKENHVTLQEIQGPPFSRSSTVTFVHKVEPESEPSEHSSHGPPMKSAISFTNLRGILKDTYKQLGGAQAVHHRERESWDR
jgi:hypothetical protein